MSDTPDPKAQEPALMKAFSDIAKLPPMTSPSQPSPEFCQCGHDKWSHLADCGCFFVDCNCADFVSLTPAPPVAQERGGEQKGFAEYFEQASQTMEYWTAMYDMEKEAHEQTARERDALREEVTRLSGLLKERTKWGNIIIDERDAAVRQRDALVAACQSVISDIEAGRMLTANRTAKLRAAIAASGEGK